MPTVRISDVAHAAGVSPSTVTRVVRESGYVSEENRKRVKKAVRELGYIPNRLAQSLKSRRSNLIGNMMPMSSYNTIFAQIGEAVDRAASKKGYNVLTLVSLNDPKSERLHLNEIIGNMAEGIIYTSGSALDDDSLEHVVRSGIPIVMVERARDLPIFDKVLVNNLLGSRLAAEHLLKKGHRRIGFVGAEGSDPVERDRFAGFQNALREAGVPLDEGLIRQMPDYGFSYGFQAAKLLAKHGIPPTAVFFASDIFVAGALQYYYSAGIRVPEDVSVIGYDNTLSLHLAPPVTSVAFPVAAMGEAAVRLIEEHSGKKRRRGKVVTLDPILVERASVRGITDSSEAGISEN